MVLPARSKSMSSGAETSSQSQESFQWYWWWPRISPLWTSRAMTEVA